MSYNTVELREEGAKEPQSHAASSSTDTNDETSRNQPLHVNLSIQGGNCGTKEKQLLGQGDDCENKLKRVNGIAELHESTRDEKRQRHSLTDGKNTLNTTDSEKNSIEFQCDYYALTHLTNQEEKATSSGHENMIHCPESSCSKYLGVEDDTSSSSSSSDDGLARIQRLQVEIKTKRQSFGVINTIDNSISCVTAKKEDIPIPSVTRKRHEKIEIDLTNDDDDYNTKDGNTQCEIEENSAEQKQIAMSSYQVTSQAPAKDRSSWMFKPPLYNEPTSKVYGDVLWHWCSKCENGMGKWTDHNACKHGKENNAFQFIFSQSKASVSSLTDLSTSTMMQNLPLNFEESKATNDQPKTKQEDTSYEKLLAKKKSREEVIDLISDSDETGNEDEFDVNDHDTSIVNEQIVNDSNQDNSEAKEENRFALNGVMPSTHSTRELQTNDSNQGTNDKGKIENEKPASPDTVIESTQSTQKPQISDSNQGTNDMVLEDSVPSDDVVEPAHSTQEMQINDSNQGTNDMIVEKLASPDTVIESTHSTQEMQINDSNQGTNDMVLEDSVPSDDVVEPAHSTQEIQINDSNQGTNDMIVEKLVSPDTVIESTHSTQKPQINDSNQGTNDMGLETSVPSDDVVEPAHSTQEMQINDSNQGTNDMVLEDSVPSDDVVEPAHSTQEMQINDSNQGTNDTGKIGIEKPASPDTVIESTHSTQKPQINDSSQGTHGMGLETSVPSDDVVEPAHSTKEMQINDSNQGSNDMVLDTSVPHCNQPKTKQEDTSYEKLLAKKKSREEVIDLISDSDETGNEDEFDVNDHDTSIVNEQIVNDSNQDNSEAKEENRFALNGVMPSTHSTRELQTNDSNQGTNDMGLKTSVLPDSAIKFALPANENNDRTVFNRIPMPMKKGKVGMEISRQDKSSNCHLKENQEEDNCKTTKTPSVNSNQSLESNTILNAIESKGMLEQSKPKENTRNTVHPFHDMIFLKKNKVDELGEVFVESPHTSEDLIDVRHFSNARGKLEEMKNRMWRDYSNERKSPVLDSEKVNLTDLEYYTFQQFSLDSIKDTDRHHQKHIGYGCLTCLHCGSKNVCLQEQSFNFLWSHVTRICNAIPSEVKESLMTLKKISRNQNIRNGKDQNNMLTMKAIFLRVKDSQITETLKLSSKKESSMQDSYRRVEPCQRESYESNGERHSLDPARSSFVSRLKDKVAPIPFSPKRRSRIPNIRHKGENGRRNFSRDPSELKEMELLDFQKHLTSEHHPILTFSILNEEKDQLFDFTAYVGKSRIPNSGNGAFLRLDKIRVGIQDKDHSTFPLTRCSLVANMPCGKVCNVTIGPNEIHEDEKAFRNKNYVRDDSLTFSSYDEGNGIINLGSYGPFFVSDLKGNHHFEVKNFLFDFEPAGWSYGYDEEDGTEETRNGDLILDITDELTGETHLRARENLPMHVNEVGHDKSLEHNVTPLQDIDGIYYFAHIKSPMKVGSEVELLVNYGDHYETVRERKGYGLSNVPDDSNEIFRVRRNQAARIITLEHIYSQTELHGLCVLVISLEKTVLGVNSITDECFMSSSLQNASRRQVRSRLRMHWISTCIIEHIDFIKKKRKQFTDYELLAESDIRKIASKMKIPPDLLRRIDDNQILKEIAYEEILEEVIFAISMPTIACNLPHPMDTCMYTKVARKLFLRLVKEVVLKVHIGTSDEATAVANIYELALLASRHVIPNDELSDVSKIMLGLDTSDNEVINDYLQKGGILEKKDAQRIRCKKIDNEVKVDTDWYMLQNVRVIHAIACEYLKFQKYYSLQSLCQQLGVNVEAAEAMVKTRIEEPYDKEKYVQQKDHRFKESINKTSHIKRTKRFSADAQEIFNREGGRQTSGFIPNVHPNVERNRNNLTFWEEKPGGDDLPEGWIIHIHNREQGPTSTSHLDWYWFTKGGKKLRSKPEIRRYIVCLEKAGGDDQKALKLFGKSR